jgi:hypothetical protein
MGPAARWGWWNAYAAVAANFNANMDDWDPFVTNGFALDRDVILFDNAGVGSSGEG